MRTIIELNKDWRFIREDAGLPHTLPTDWEVVDLPHTWNRVDGMDGNGGYYRGSCWYAKTFSMPRQPLSGGKVYVELPAAGQQAVVYVNGVRVVEHLGGYSLFRGDITPYCKPEGENLLVINCSNQHREDVYPQSADFTFYGGLYRGVHLISVPEAHFDLDYYGGNGLTVTPRPLEDGGAEFRLKAFAVNCDEAFTIQYSIRDPEGNEVAGATRPASEAGITLYIPEAKLWSVDSPALYKVTALLLRRNEVYDRVCCRVGVRSFSCHPEKGFILNGTPLPLRGVSRHQDRLYKGNALSRLDHYLDAHLIKELGANTIRLAHYQHAQEFYDACDELGFVVWAEIPFISVFNKTPEAHENCVTQLKELIVQNYNHPSICFWGISNEILIGGISEELVEAHHQLNELCHQMDPTRLTTIAHVSMTPTDSPMHHITDIMAYNHYFGWYGGKMEDNGPWLDEFHRKHPELCLGVSEYGCEGIVTYHGPHPQCKDYSEEYQARYHEHMAAVFHQRPWIWGTYVWNMFDFGCAARNEGGVAGRNNKGLMTMDRKIKKDSYYVYQSYWSKEPMVHICGRRYAQRAGEATEVRVYSNQAEVSLFCNGTLVEIQKGDHVFVFQVPLEVGQNRLVARAGSVSDSITLERVEQEPSIYTLPDVNERREGVENWFKSLGKMDLTAPMEFPHGCFSVRDTMEALNENPEALSIAAEGVKLATGFTLNPGEGMWDMMKAMSLESLLSMASGTMPEGFLESINHKLTQIKK